MKAAPFVLVAGGLASCAGGSAQEPAQEPAQGRDIREVEPDLELPAMTRGEPRAGARVKQVLPASAQTAVHHALYLPTDWAPEGRYPVIVEYAGNGGYRGPFGDVCTGTVEGCKLGYGLTAGEGHLWVCLPYLDASGTSNVRQWWGSGPDLDPGPTVAYCREAVRWICEQWGGDSDAVVLVGFSRGALACNYIGLHDDQIAGLWRGFVPFSHYDGVAVHWPYPHADRRSALERLRRLDGRPQFICSESLPGNEPNVATTQQYLEATGVEGDWTFVPTGFRNHSDAWVLRPSPARSALRAWLEETLAGERRR
jgi:hypothetical protein